MQLVSRISGVIIWYALQVEYLISDVLGPAEVGGFLKRLYSLELQEELIDPSRFMYSEIPDQTVHIELSNYILWWLQYQLGSRNVALFVHTFLHPQRFQLN